MQIVNIKIQKNTQIYLTVKFNNFYKYNFNWPQDSK